MSAQTAASLTVEPGLCPSPDARGLGGLMAGDSALPLRSCRVRGEIIGGLARTTMVQTFENTLETPMEAVHIFPLPEQGAVVSMVLTAGEVRVVAECRERREAESTFRAARAAGHRAALLSQERDEVHTLRVTNLPPKTRVQVELVVEEALEVVDGRIRYRFPTTIAPRFTPGTPLGHMGPGVQPDTDIVMDASRITPPLRLSGGTLLDLEVVVHGAVRAVSSALHAVCIELDDGVVRVAPSQQATADRDFVLAITPGVPDAAGARAWTDGTHTVVLLEPPADALPPSIPRDAVFVVDISGSMGGRKMEAAKLALKTALHGLMPGDRFLLIAFDDRVETFRSELLPVSDAALVAADRWIDGLRPRGGTMMAPALEQALQLGQTPRERQRTVLFVTDGQSTDEERLLQLLWRHRGEARVFPLGIDTAVNSALLRRMARLGGGVCELTEPDADIEAVVARLEARFGAPLIEHVTVRGATPAQLPMPALFLGRPATIVLEGGSERITLGGTSPQGDWSVEMRPEKAPFALGACWARARVLALQDRLLVKPFEEELLKPEIVRIALEHGVASRWTSFVAVDSSAAVDQVPVEVVQPAELPHGWALPPGMAAVGAMPMMARMAMPMMAAAPSVGRARRTTRKRSGGVGAAIRGLFSRSAAPPPPPSVEPDPVELAMCAPAEEEAVGDAFATLGLPAAPAPRATPAGAPSDAPGELARRQSANGSFDGDVVETLVALLILVRAGHTRRVGLRRRVVQKAVGWLATQPADARITRALALLARLEGGSSVLEEDYRAVSDLLGTAGSRVFAPS